ncbi:MAG: tetratricopeptide repeat protein [Solirubrobacterales bacterium]|nr:tetratricopeptide repeat protein [Solirubrobacterales bacterium]
MANGVDAGSKAAAADSAAAEPLSTAVELCASGAAKEAAGDDEAATKDYLKALDEDPEAVCKQALADLNAPPYGGLGETADDALDWIGALAKWLAVVVAAVALALAVGLLALATVLRPLAREFEGLPVIGPHLRPRLKLEVVDDGALGDAGKGAGAALTARIKERLHRYHEQAQADVGAEQDLDVGALADRFADLAGDDAGLKDAVAQASEVHDHAKFAAAVVKLASALLPRRRFVVFGLIDPPDGDSMSATVSIEDGGNVPAVARVAGKGGAKPPANSDYLGLADPIAIWVQYEVARLLGGESALPADGPESFALAREAGEHQAARRYTEALALYERAVILYPRNWAAWLGQASMEVRLDRYDRAVDTLARARAAIEQDGSGGGRLVADYYRLVYQHLAQRLNRTFVDGAGSSTATLEDDLAQGEAEAGAFVQQVATRIAELEDEVNVAPPVWWRRPLEWLRHRRQDDARDDADRLLQFLDRVVHPCATVVLAGFQARRGEVDGARLTVGSLSAADAKRYSYRAWYDLACLEATIAAAGHDEALDSALVCLRRAFTVAPGRRRYALVEWARIDPSLKAVRESHGDEFRTLVYEFAPVGRVR